MAKACKHGWSRSWYLSLALAMAVAASPSSAFAMEAEGANAAHGRIELVDLDGPSERRYRISIAYPDQPAPPVGYPVIYVVDANAIFPTVADSARLQGLRPDWTGMGQALVVGIGYPSDALFESRARSFDFTPALPETGQTRSEGKGPREGGADAFLTFIETKVKPLVAAKASVDAAHQTLLGYSLGGLFTLHALFAKPESFQTYIAISPSVWWGQGYLLAAAERFSSSRGRGPRRLLLTVGEYEQALSPAAREAPGAGAQQSVLDRYRMVEGVGRLAGALSHAPGLTVRHRILDGQDHASGPPAAISLGIRFALLPDTQFDPLK